VGRSRAAVSNLLRLLELPPAIRVLVETRALEMGHARALLTAVAGLAIALARQAAEHGWSVREVEHRVQQFAAGKVPASKAARQGPRRAAAGRHRSRWSASCPNRWAAKVAVQHGRGGKGKLVIHYTDLDSAGRRAGAPARRQA
jgi:ParB family chromosome partitioning protein